MSLFALVFQVENKHRKVRGVSEDFVFATAEDGLVGKIFFLFAENGMVRARRFAFPSGINRKTAQATMKRKAEKAEESFPVCVNGNV